MTPEAREALAQVLQLVEEWRSVSSAGECPRCGRSEWKMCSPPICARCGYRPSLSFEEVSDTCAELAAAIRAGRVTITEEEA